MIHRITLGEPIQRTVQRPPGFGVVHRPNLHGGGLTVSCLPMFGLASGLGAPSRGELRCDGGRRRDGDRCRCCRRLRRGFGGNRRGGETHKGYWRWLAPRGSPSVGHGLLLPFPYCSPACWRQRTAAKPPTRGARAGSTTCGHPHSRFRRGQRGTAVCDEWGSRADRIIEPPANRTDKGEGVAVAFRRVAPRWPGGED